MAKIMPLNIDCIQPGQFDANIEIFPSDRIYFNDFPYRIKINGPGWPHPNYDHQLHFEITQFMKSCNMFWKRELNKQAGRSIYLPTYDDVLWFCSWKGEHVESVHGPISDKHVAALFTPGLSIRENKYFNKYDYRIELWFGLSSSPSSKCSAIKDLIEMNLEDFRWNNTDFNWYYNYLYCHYDEFKEIEGFFNLSFKNFAVRYDKVKLFSEL